MQLFSDSDDKKIRFELFPVCKFLLLLYYSVCKCHSNFENFTNCQLKAQKTRKSHRNHIVVSSFK